jgi:protein O-mannosyl-transferase
MSIKKNMNKKNIIASLPFKQFLFLSILTLTLITTAIYYKSLNNEFTRWDDDLYVTDNPDIVNLSTDLTGTLKKTFTGYVNGNYHPVTMLSFCLEHAVFKLNSKAYHTTNLVIHILNSVLVLLFIWLLTKQRWTAFITALLFAIHPMHVESVAWVSERKDLLYAFFFIAALCTYLLYIQKEKRKIFLYIITFMLFVLSCLSKAMAVCLPIVLLLIDYYVGRKISKKTILEKVPFLVISFTLGIVAIQAQKAIGAIDTDMDYNFFDRILFSCYGLMMYLWKLFVPIHNSCFYNYPAKQNGHYPIVFYLAPILVLAIAYGIYKTKKVKKEILFSAGFFITTIFLVLQILPVGSAIIAERYTYLSYTGVFFLLATGCNTLIQNKKKFFNLFIAALIIITLTLSVLSYKASMLWKDGLTLLEHAFKTEKYDVCGLHYKNLSIACFYSGQYEKAAHYYTNAINKTKNNTGLYCDRGVSFYKMGAHEKAIADLSYVISRESNNLNAYHYRGMAYFELHKYPEAIYDLSTAIALNPTYIDHFYSRGLAYYIIGNYTEALKDYNYLIQHNNFSTEIYNNRGLIYLKLKQYDKALTDFDSAIKYDSKNSNAWFNKGLVYDETGRVNEAIDSYTKAITYNPGYVYSYKNRATAYLKIKQYKLALADVLKTRELGLTINEEFIEMLKRNSN